MKLPEEIKVCGHSYKVLFPYAFREIGNFDGQADHEMLEIRIRGLDSGGNVRPNSVIAENLIHEILHIADGLSGHQVFAENEPAIVGLSNVLYGILRENNMLSEDMMPDETEEQGIDTSQ